MIDRTSRRLEHIAEAIGNIRMLLAQKSRDDLDREPVTRAAFERFLEIVSEASRHLPAHEKAQYPDVPWNQIADLGNHLRHGYHKIDAGILWAIYLKDLNPLEYVISAMLRGRSPPPSHV